MYNIEKVFFDDEGRLYRVWIDSGDDSVLGIQRGDGVADPKKADWVSSSFRGNEEEYYLGCVPE